MTTPDPSHPLNDRLQRLEESLGFAEHEQEQLGEQVARLQQQVQALSQRMVQLEGQLERANRPATRAPEQDGTDADPA